MQTFQVTMQKEINVTFLDAKKAEEFFLSGTWAEAFWVIKDMDDLAKNIAEAVSSAESTYCEQREAVTKNPEGFGFYVQQPGGFFVASWHEMGEITVNINHPLEAIS